MKRLKDDFLNIVDLKVGLKDKKVLEIGCGIGTRSIQIAQKCKSLVAIDPEADAIKTARQINTVENVKYLVGSAEKLSFDNDVFDVVIFTLSFHHVPIPRMRTAIKEAVRVSKKEGKVIFLEPTQMGTFFDSELYFDACDGDERNEKTNAYSSMLDAQDLLEKVEEIPDETILQFKSYEDFVEVMKPKKNLTELHDFLKEYNFTLNAHRRINIFKVKKS